MRVYTTHLGRVQLGTSSLLLVDPHSLNLLDYSPRRMVPGHSSSYVSVVQCFSRPDVIISQCSDQQQLAEQIASTQETLIHLKNRYNAHSPVGRLPPEILSEIFLTQAAKLRDERLSSLLSDQYNFAHARFYTWMNVSQVCHHWRTVALGCAKLWAWIAFEPRLPEDFYQLLLERARDSIPLTVVFTIFDPRSYCHGCLSSERFHVHYDNALEQLHTILPRVRELLLYLDWEEHDEIWDDLNVATDALEIMRVEAVGAARVTEMRGSHVVLPAELFASHAPRLHSLAISGIGFSWPSTIFAHSLRHLEISKCEFEDGDDDFCRLIPIIHPLALLETLKIIWWRRTNAQHVVLEGYETVVLPHLQQLTVSAECQHVMTFLTHIRVPPSTSLHVNILDIVNSSMKERIRQTCHSIFHSMSVHCISYALGVPIQRFSESEAAFCHIWAVGSDGLKTDRGSWNKRLASGDMPPARLTLECPAYSGSEQPISAVLRELDLTKMRTLHVGGLTTGRAWASALANAESLEYLRITGQSAFAIPSLLAEGIHALDIGEIALEMRAGLDEWHWAKYNMASEDTPDLREEYGVTEEVIRLINHGTDAGQGSATRLLFPRLRILQVVDVDLVMPSGSKDKSPLQGYQHATVFDLLRFKANGTKYGFDVAALAKCLRSRRTHHAPDLAHIQFEGCHSANVTEQLAPLDGLAAEVWWDGQRVSL